MHRLLVTAGLLLISACAAADGQSGPNPTALTRTVLSGTSAADGSANVTLPSGAGSASQLPTVMVYALDEINDRWSNVSDGDGTLDGNGSWTVEAPSGGSLVVHMRDLGSRAEGNAGETRYQVVVIH